MSQRISTESNIMNGDESNETQSKETPSSKTPSSQTPSSKAPSSETPSSETQSNNVTTDPQSPCSHHPTGFVEASFTEALALSMYNSIFNQQSSQMTTLASVTNACGRLLRAPIPVEPKEAEEEPVKEEEVEASVEKKKPKKRFNVFRFMKNSKKEESDTEDEKQ
jgi:Killing trait